MSSIRQAQLTQQELISHLNDILEAVQPTEENASYWKLIKQSIQDTIQKQPLHQVRTYWLRLIEVFGNRLEKIETVIASLKASGVTPNPEKPNHTVYSIPYIINNLLNFPEILNHAEKCLAFFKAQDPNQFSIFIDELIQQGLVYLVQTQDPDQAYHTLLHAIEMRMDSFRKMQAILRSQWSQIDSTDRSPVGLFIAALAAFHDIVQGQGQYKNELESADIFWGFFQKVYQAHFKIRAPLELAKLAEIIIIDGTLLNISTSPQKENASFDIIQQKVRQSLHLQEQKSGPAFMVLEAGTRVLAQADTHRAVDPIVQALQFPNQEGCLPSDLKAVLRQVLLKGLKAQHFNEEQASALVDQQLLVFCILMGQNTRMMADGPFRKFRDTETSPSMQTLMQLFDLARAANQSSTQRGKFDAGINDFISQGLMPILTDNLVGPYSQSDFSQKQNDQQIAESYRATGQLTLAQAFQSPSLPDKLPPKWKGKLKNAWNVHAQLFLPIIHAALKEDRENRAPLLSCIIFCAANQQGLDMLASQPELLASLYQGVYGVKIAANLAFKEARQAAAAFMHLSQNREMSQALKGTIVPTEAITKLAQAKLQQFYQRLSYGQEEKQDTSPSFHRKKVSRTPTPTSKNNQEEKPEAPSIQPLRKNSDSPSTTHWLVRFLEKFKPCSSARKPTTPSAIKNDPAPAASQQARGPCFTFYPLSSTTGTTPPPTLSPKMKNKP